MGGEEEERVGEEEEVREWKRNGGKSGKGMERDIKGESERELVLSVFSLLAFFSFSIPFPLYSSLPLSLFRSNLLIIIYFLFFIYNKTEGMRMW